MMLFLTTVPSPQLVTANNIVANTEVVSKTTGMFLRTTRSEGGSAAIADKPQPTSILGERDNGVHVDSVMRGHILMGRVLHIHTTTSCVNG